MLDEPESEPAPFVLRALPARPGTERLPKINVDDNAALLDMLDAVESER